MSEQSNTEMLLDIFIFETSQLIEQLEFAILDTEKSSCYSPNAINEIFRIMHSIKGSSAMMMYDDISILAHAMEDLFFYIRENKPNSMECSNLSDIVFEGVDFIKVELEKIKNGDKADGDPSGTIKDINEFLESIKEKKHSEREIEERDAKNDKQHKAVYDSIEILKGCDLYKAIVFFDDDCQMESLRAYTLVQDIKDFVEEVYYIPEDIMESDDSTEVIREQGLALYIRSSKSYKEINDFLIGTVFLKELKLEELEDDQEFKQFSNKELKPGEKIDNSQEIQAQDHEEDESKEHPVIKSAVQSIINVNVAKLDKIMDLMGEMVIAEAMVVQNPDIKGLKLNNFKKATRHLHKITNEMQDMIMSVRMVPIASTFQKMHRIVRDMSKKLEKEIELQIIGEDTEVDKNIIEHISDPLMHLVRNAIDHGIENIADRVSVGKSQKGIVTLEAKNAGSDVLIIVKDDGSGLNKEKILQRAKENNLLTKPENEMTDREIYNLTMLPGFSTKDNVSEFSGRGVGMDVVVNNVESVGGGVYIDSTKGIGTTVTLKIPLTLAIIDGMNICVGNSRYTIPTTAIQESFRPKEKDLLTDPDGNEMIMVRGQCYPILRLHEFYNVKTDTTQFAEGILIMVEQDEKSLCLFADQLLGQQQVVVKALPNYIKNFKKIGGLAGCTLLGDGNISLILDIGDLVNCNKRILRH